MTAPIAATPIVLAATPIRTGAAAPQVAIVIATAATVATAPITNFVAHFGQLPVGSLIFKVLFILYENILYPRISPPTPET